MKLLIRYFAIGILTASLVFSISLYFFNETSADLENESIENITSFLEDEGYRVITEDEYISFSVNGKENNENQDEESDETDNESNSTDNAEVEDEPEDKQDEEKPEKDQEKPDSNKDKDKDSTDKAEENNSESTIYKYTLNVEPNMLAPTVSKLLLENKIIDDAEAFTRYLEDEGYSKYIQLGKHEVTSDMSFNQLAEKITSN